MNRVQFLAVTDFSLYCGVQTGSETHSAFGPMGIGDVSLGNRVAGCLLPSRVGIDSVWKGYLSTSPYTYMACCLIKNR